MPSRRTFLKAAALGSAAAAAPEIAHAGPSRIPPADRMGVLVDLTACVGCRSCEAACKKAHGMLKDTDSLAPAEMHSTERRRPSTEALTVVNEYKGGKEGAPSTFVKVQCMHCDYPSCESACIVGAFSKKEGGEVLWDGSKCIGCRYCMVACPFQIPTFQFDKALQPEILKCDFCFQRRKDGGVPACVEICPMEVLTYGRRSTLLEIARKKIENYPDRYTNHIYGELEAGGTSWMYIGKPDFKELQFPDLKKDPMPGTSESIQHGIFAYFVPPISLYALLGGLMWITKNRKPSEEEIGE
ncbi:MAG TPA: 4Fe-4S dicluster domain-containing protein [Bacteroidota bacterium]|nr:4Fe-4S dicluster domain-containing protein [Bacteroidota bacterium]